MYSSQVLMIKTYEELVTSYNKAKATSHQIEKDNCKFVATSVEYLGHKIDTKRKHTLEHKVEAIQNLLTPKNTQQLKSFLGLVHYYGKFVSYLLLLIHPFNRLLKANAKWSWSDLSKQAFQQTKMKLSFTSILVHYDPSLPLRLSGDASQYGIEAVILQIGHSGEEQLVA